MARPTTVKLENEYYEPVKNWLDKILEERFSSHHLEITANGVFSDALQAQIPRHRDMIFSFLREAAPDITGFVKLNPTSRVEFIVAEVKNAPIKLDDIYQTRKYAELFGAIYALLVSTADIPEKIKRLSKAVFPFLLHIPPYEKVSLVSFKDNGADVTWFEEDPFARVAARAAAPPSS